MSEIPQQRASASSGCTCFRLRKAARRVSQIYDHYLEPHGLTVTQYSLLANLGAFDGISIGALAERLIMDPTTLTRNLRPLERAGLVALAPDARDRRARRLHLTQNGREALARAKPAWTDAQRHVEKAIGLGEIPALHAALDQALDRLAR